MKRIDSKTSDMIFIDYRCYSSLIHDYSLTTLVIRYIYICLFSLSLVVSRRVLVLDILQRLLFDIQTQYYRVDSSGCPPGSRATPLMPIN